MLSSSSDPMRSRVSIVELPWCGCKNTFGSDKIARVDRRLAVEHVEPRRHDPAAAQRRNQRLVVHQIAARDVRPPRRLAAACSMAAAPRMRRVAGDEGAASIRKSLPASRPAKSAW